MSRYRELTLKVDTFFERVRARHGTAMQCDSGCSDCCHVRLTVTGVEVTAIRDEISTWPAERRQALAAQARAALPDRCAALDPAGRCSIYDARPLVCRSHGVPIRMRHHRSLPVIASPGFAGARSTAEGRCGDEIESCFRNFTEVEPDGDCVLDQETLSALLLAVDREAGSEGRFDLAELLASC